MRKRSSMRRETDPNRIAFLPVQKVIANGEAEPAKNPHAVALGRLGGAKGGKARAAKLSAKKRAEIARRAATVRWEKPR